MAEIALLPSDNDNDSNDRKMRATMVKMTRFLLLLPIIDITNVDMLV